MTCVVLAGGSSRRLGRDKMQEELNGEPLLLRVVRRLAALGTEIVVVTAPGADFRFPEGLRVRLATDLRPGRGPIAGVHAGLSAARSSHCFVAAGDMPFLNLDLVRYMLEISGPYDVVIPRHGVLLEPLHAVYSRRCLGPIEAALEAGENRIVAFFPHVNVRYVEGDVIERLDPGRLSFFNVNTQADMERARRELGAWHGDCGFRVGRAMDGGRGARGAGRVARAVRFGILGRV